MLLEGKSFIDGCSVLKLEYIVLFKIKAWLDLITRINIGEKIDSKTIKKHKNDIFRLVINISPLSRIRIDDEIQDDILEFIEKIKKDHVDLDNLDIHTFTLEEILGRIREIYLNK